MNKGRRQELTQLKFKKRLSQLGLKKEDGNMFAFKSHGKPCSCSLCSPEKYNRSKFKEGFIRLTKEQVESDRSSAYNYIA